MITDPFNSLYQDLFILYYYNYNTCNGRKQHGTNWDTFPAKD